MKNPVLHVAFLTAIAILGIGGGAAHAADAFKSLAQGVEYGHDVRAAGPSRSMFSELSGRTSGTWRQV